MIITIDGPSYSGKSTTAQQVAQELGFKHINTGLLYRALAYLLLDQGCTQEQLQNPDHDAVVTFLNPYFLVYTFDEKTDAVLLYEHVDITAHLKLPHISKAASIISAIPFVRTTVNAHLHFLMQEYDIVIDGRDCGSVVFPQAQLKIFLTADPAVRAQRYVHDMKTKNITLSFEQALADIRERDTRDKERAISPLIVPQDAVIIDNSSLLPEEVVEQIVDMAQATF